MNRLHIAVLASGRGSNLQSIIDSIEKGALNAQIACVASDVKNANALERAREHSIEALFLDPHGKTKEEYYSQIADALEKRRGGLGVVAGVFGLPAPPVPGQNPGGGKQKPPPPL